MNNPLLDRKFLKELDKQHLRFVYAKVISLNLDEEPVEEITGRITGGTINIDGNSAVRRTCSISISAAAETTLTDYYWVLKTKFRLELGLENILKNEYPNYPDIIWFPMGLFVINNFSCSHTTNNLTIQMSGKDKMSLLNGDLGGQFTGSIDLGTSEEIDATYEPGPPSNDKDQTSRNKLYCDTLEHKFYKWVEYDKPKEDGTKEEWVEASPTDYVYKKETLPIRDIIFHVMRSIGGEPIHNIIVNDLDEVGVELLTYRADNKPLYYFEDAKAEANNNILAPTISALDVGVKLYAKNENWYASKLSLMPIEQWLFLDIPSANTKEDYPFVWSKQKILDPNFGLFYKIPLAHLENDRVFQLFGATTTNGWSENYLLYQTIKPNSEGKEESIWTNVFNNEEVTLSLSPSGIYEIKTDDGKTEEVYLLAETEFHFKVADSLNSTTPSLCAILEEDGTVKEGNEIYIYRIQSGDTAGYRASEIVYPGDLIAAVGESITSVFDKITKALGNFEYFYDLQGRFVFQKKKTYVNTAWSPLNQETNDVELVTDNTRLAYYFTDGDMLISASNAPAISNLKNDFAVWGTRKTSSGAELPIHMRYAIHRKPMYYKNYYDKVYYTVEYLNYQYLQDESDSLLVALDDSPLAIVSYQRDPSTGQVIGDIPSDENKPVDWREIIYQMAQDYQNNYTKHDFIQTLIRNNRNFYPTGKTGYEHFYDDMIGFWREIYNPEPTEEDLKNNTFNKAEKDEADYFNVNVYHSPQLLPFWIDFLDTYSTMGKYSIKNIGDRQKIASDNTVKAIYYNQPPNVIFYNPDLKNTTKEAIGFYVREGYEYRKDGFNEALGVENQGINNGNNESNPDVFYVAGEEVNNFEKTEGYVYFQLPVNLENLFIVSAQGKSAKNQIDEWVYNYANVTEAINLTTVPVYYLDTNTIIYVNDKESKAQGEYIINKLTYNLTYNGNMTLNASKVNRRLY